MKRPGRAWNYQASRHIIQFKKWMASKTTDDWLTRSLVFAVASQLIRTRNTVSNYRSTYQYCGHFIFAGKSEKIQYVPKQNESNQIKYQIQLSQWINHIYGTPTTRKFKREPRHISRVSTLGVERSVRQMYVWCVKALFMRCLEDKYITFEDDDVHRQRENSNEASPSLEVLIWGLNDPVAKCVV